jgi:crotonobetainyl-CoA hydratase
MSVRFEVERHVAQVTIDRPERLNAVDTATEARLQEIWRELEVRDDVRCVVLTGAGERAFSAGADMKDPGAKTGLAYWAEGRPGGFGGIALRTTLDIPVIGRVNGLALGGGFEMVLGCDIVVACEEAEFGLTEPRVGRLPLEGGMVLLPRGARSVAGCQRRMIAVARLPLADRSNRQSRAADPMPGGHGDCLADADRRGARPRHPPTP